MQPSDLRLCVCQFLSWYSFLLVVFILSGRPVVASDHPPISVVVKSCCCLADRFGFLSNLSCYCVDALGSFSIMVAC